MAAPYDRATAFRHIAELHRAEGDEDPANAARWQARLLDFMTVPRGEQRVGADGRFSPQYIDPAAGIVYPAMETCNDDAVAAIEALLAAIRNPIHRARCADFLWEKRHNYRVALDAVDAYLDAADICNRT